MKAPKENKILFSDKLHVVRVKTQFCIHFKFFCAKYCRNANITNIKLVTIKNRKIKKYIIFFDNRI